MQRLSGMDASFLYTETPTGHMHVTGVMIVDPTALEGEYGYDNVVALVEERLHLIPMFRQRLMPVPLNVDHPVWIEDPDFDIHHHIHAVHLPEPGTRRELAALVGDLASHPLDRSRALWEMWVATGAEDGTVALITKMHHAAIDGVTGADIMTHLFDLEQDAPPPPPPEEEWVPDEIPTDTKLVSDAVASQLIDPLRAFRAARRTVETVANVASTMVGRGEEERVPAMPFTGPDTALTGSISPRRAVAFGQAALDDLKTIKNVYEAKINDVVLATCTWSLRNYLLARDDLPDEPLVVMCPVSTHGTGSDEGTNQVSSMAVHLPIQMDDPVDQLLEIREDTVVAKEMQNAIGAEMLSDITQFTPPAVFNQAMRLYARSGLADRHRPVQNGVISNVPGPPIPLFSAGAEVVAVYPFGPLIEGAGLNITVISNRGNMDFGVVVCPEMIPGVWDIATGWEEAVLTLKERAEAEAG